MDLGKSISYVFQDPKWFKKCLLAFFMLLLPIVGQTIVVGWLLDTMRNINAGSEHPIPEWSGDDLARWLGRGVAATMAVMAWVVPCMVVIYAVFACGSLGLQILGGGVIGAAGAGGRGASGLATGLGSALGIVTLCLSCLLALFVFIIALGSMVPYVRFATTDQIDVGLEYLANFKLLFANIGPFLLVALVAVVAIVVMYILILVTCGIGAFVLVPYFMLMVTYMFAGLSRKLAAASPATV